MGSLDCEKAGRIGSPFAERFPPRPGLAPRSPPRPAPPLYTVVPELYPALKLRVGPFTRSGASLGVRPKARQSRSVSGAPEPSPGFGIPRRAAASPTRVEDSLAAEHPAGVGSVKGWGPCRPCVSSLAPPLAAPSPARAELQTAALFSVPARPHARVPTLTQALISSENLTTLLVKNVDGFSVSVQWSWTSKAFII